MIGVVTPEFGIVTPYNNNIYTCVLYIWFNNLEYLFHNFIPDLVGWFGNQTNQ